MKRRLITSLFLTTIACSSLFGQEPAEEVKLPKVLIIGDSISIGFTPHVVKQLEGKAAVKHHAGNAQHTGKGLAKLDRWIGKTEWDVIHFNWGLWDLCYRNAKTKVQGKRDKANGTLTTTLEQYEENLEELVSRLKRTGAKLIWAQTTVIPEGEAGRIVGDDEKYNEVAAGVMDEHGIIINDLHSLTKEFPADLFSKPGDVHYTKDGYRQIAEQVTTEIMSALEEAP